MLCAVVLFSTLLVVGSARAAPPPLLPVVIRGEAEPLVVELYPPKAKPSKDAPLARCTSPCEAMLPAGRYRLYVRRGEGTVSGSRIIDVSRPLTLTASPKSVLQRTGGLVLGIAGPTMAAYGALMGLSKLCGLGHGDDDCSSRRETAEAIGPPLIFGGLVMTTVGWLLYADSFRASVKQTPLQYGLAPTLFPRGRTASDHVLGFVFTGSF